LDYTTLIGAKTLDGSIRNWLNDSTLPATTILDMAESYIYRRLRVREMQKFATGSTVVGDATIALPTDYLTPLRFMFTGTEKTEIKHLEIGDVMMRLNYDWNGDLVPTKPQYFAAMGTTIQFDAPADQVYPYQLLYFAQPASLSPSNATNFLTTRSPRLVMAACCMLASEFDKDDKEKQWWLAIADNELQQLNREFDQERGRNLHLAVRAE
jgi:hypothetical protein